jgi:sodium/proline symporter
VAGHGIDAAIAMVRVRETIRAISGFVDTDPGAILELVDRGFVATHPESLATAAFAFYDPATHRFTFARAGHPAPVLLRDGVAALLDAEPGPPLGVDVDSRYVTTTHVLQPGDSIVFYTDGLLEMERDVIGGERRFLAMLERHGNDVEMLVDETLAGSQRDDVALLRLTVVETDVTSWRFQSDDASGADDSRFAFASHLRRRIADDAAIAAAELVFGELIGNVVRHAPGPIEIELAWRGGTPLLIVRDRGPQFTLSDASLPADPLAEGGRGLYLVEQFASMPVVMPRFGGGNEVIVALPVAEAVNDYGKYVPSGAA